MPRRASALAGLLAASTLAPSVAASDSLATPITSELAADVWPIEVEIEIREATEGVKGSGMTMPKKRVVVPDGHRTSWASAVWTPRGQRFFELDVVARQHPRDEIEVEWDIVVSRAPVLPMAVGEYVLHRLQLASPLRLGPKELEIARSDISSTLGQPLSETVEIDGQTYEIRISAHRLRG